MIQITDEYKLAAKAFRTAFGYGVPLAMVPPRTDTDELIKLIGECIDEGSDNLLERLGVIRDFDSLF